MALNDEYELPGDICHSDFRNTSVILVDAGKDDETDEQLWELKIVSGNGVFAVTSISADDIRRIGMWLIQMAKHRHISPIEE